MAKKQTTKRAFDWRTYSKPTRLLSSSQEEAFASGLLAPILEWTVSDPRSRFEIRSRSASLYHRGVNLGRVTGEGPFSTELVTAEGEAPERVELMDAQGVSALLERLGAVRATIDAAADAPGAARNHRSYAASIACANKGTDLAADALIVVDAEHALGRRRLDLVALLRSEGVSGPGGFANPDLVFIDVRVPGQSLTGQIGLEAIADDLADFGKALSGEHRRRTAAEITELVAQKVRLGLLPAELEVRMVAETLPHLLVAFAAADPTPTANDAAIIGLHERLSSRHYPTHRLWFAHFTEVPEDGDGLTLEEGDAMDYRAFKAYRYQGR